MSCERLCPTAWPPLWTDSKPQARDGIDPSLIGTIDYQGRQIATCNGWPLYHYNLDEELGEIDGHRVKVCGGEWLLLTPEGGKVRYSEVPDQQGG